MEENERVNGIAEQTATTVAERIDLRGMHHGKQVGQTSGTKEPTNTPGGSRFDVLNQLQEED